MSTIHCLDPVLLCFSKCSTLASTTYTLLGMSERESARVHEREPESESESKSEKEQEKTSKRARQ